MDTYDLDGICLWHHLPAGNGTGGMFIVLAIDNGRSHKIAPMFELTTCFD
jgi:hypothetical protein